MKKLGIIFIFVFIVFLASCSNSGFEVINATEAKTMMDNDSSIKLIDVREQYEYDESHIEGAILIPLGTIEDNALTILPNLDTTIIIYCRSGNRSNDAAKLFVELGYTDVYDMGGIINWPYDVIN